MRILVNRWDFSSQHYKLHIGEAALELEGENGAYSLPYTEIQDFYVTRDKKGRHSFTSICHGRMYEGKILDAKDVESFTTALREKLDGIINIEVRKN